MESGVQFVAIIGTLLKLEWPAGKKLNVNLLH